MKSPLRSVVPLLSVLLVGALASFALHAAEDPDAPPAAAAKVKPLLVVPKDRVLVQRGFVPFEGAKKLYACAVGTPAGVHYAYDCESGAILAMWRGAFIDVAEMWDGRSFNQTARPAGDAMVTMNDRPVFAGFPDRLLEYPKAWPKQSDALYASQGYELDSDGTPTFLATFAELTIRDRLSPSPDGRGLGRTLTFDGRLTLWETWVLLAEAETITPRAGGYRIGEHGWQLVWPAGSVHQPIIRSAPGSRQQLVVRLTKTTLTKPVSYNLEWQGRP